MNIRSIEQSFATFLQESLIPDMTARQKTILLIAFSALALIAACFFVRRYLSKKIVQQPTIASDKQTQTFEKSEPASADTNPTAVDISQPKSEPAPADTNPNAAAISQPKMENQKAVPSEHLKLDEADNHQIDTSPLSPIATSPSGAPGLDRETITRIINCQGSVINSKDISIEDCEAFAPDLLKFIKDDEVQKRECYPNSELPEFVRIAYSQHLEKYLGRNGLQKRIVPTLRLMVLKGQLTWCGGSPRCGVYAGLDDAHKKTESGCFTRDDLIQLDSTMQRECWKTGDLTGLTPEETAIYHQAVEQQNRTIYSRFVYKKYNTLEINQIFNPVGKSLLQKLVKAGKIHAFNFTSRMFHCHIMLTEHDVKRDAEMIYNNWVDQVLLQNYENGLVRPVSTPSNDLEEEIVEFINQRRFSRLTSDSLRAFEYKSANYKVKPQIEEVLQGLVGIKQIHAYAEDYPKFYIQLTAQDDISKIFPPRGWKYS